MLSVEDSTDLCFAEDEIGRATLSYKQEDADWSRYMRGKQHINEGPGRTSARPGQTRPKGPVTQTSQLTMGKDYRKEDNKHERTDGAQYGPAEKKKGLRRHKSNGLPGPHGHRDTEPAGTKDHR